ncbi:MAG: LytR/AlgR family response regulator transcription factor [Chitinophagales bacterium]
MTGPTLRVLIVDDEPRAREVLRYYLEKAGGLTVVGEAANGVEAVRQVATLAPDAVFLDVRMPEMNGLELARLLHGQGPAKPHLVFVTAFEEHALAAFESEAVDYLVKPLTAARVLQAVERLRRRLVGPAPSPAVAAAPPSPSAEPAARHRRLAFSVSDGKQGQRTVLLPISSVLAVEAQGKSALVWTRRAKLATNLSLSTVEELLPGNLFLRVHRSYLVNLQAIAELFADGRTHALKVEGYPDAIPVSRERVGTLRQALGVE